MLRLLSLLLAMLSVTAWATKIEVYAPEQAAYQYIGDDGEPTGFVVEFARLVLVEAGISSRVQIMPWPRILETKGHSPDTLFFSVYRNKITEKQFRWVAPVYQYKVFAYRLKGRNQVQLNTPADLGKYKIGALPDGARLRYLQGRGLDKQVELSMNDEINIRKFFGARFDLLLEDPVMLEHTTKRLGLDLRLAERVLEVPELAGEGHMAFSLTTSDALVQRVRDAMVRVKAKPAYQKLARTYGIPAE